MHTQTLLSHDDAARAIAAMRAELERRGLAAVFAVTDPHGELIALLRMDGALVSSVAVATGKAFTAARLRRPSRRVGDTKAADPSYDVAYYGDPRYVGFPGGLPVLHGGALVGAVGVSGLPSDVDEEIAALGVAAILES